jgi:hypothetical protein
MPLALTVDKIETVPEALRGAYVADGDKFRLDADVPDVTGLRNTVAATRAERDALDKQVKAWGKLGKSPDEIAEMVAAAEATATEIAKKKGDFDGILTQHKTKWDGEKQVLVGERDAALSVARSAVVDSGILGALSQNKATGEGSAILPRILGDRVKTEFTDGKFVSTIMQADGKTPMIGSGSNGAATFDDLVKEAIKTFPSLFEGTGAGGGGTPSKQAGGSGGKTLTRSEFEKLGPLDRASKMKDGFKVVD